MKIYVQTVTGRDEYLIDGPLEGPLGLGWTVRDEPDLLHVRGVGPASPEIQDVYYPLCNIVSWWFV